MILHIVNLYPEIISLIYTIYIYFMDFFVLFFTVLIYLLQVLDLFCFVAQLGLEL